MVKLIVGPFQTVAAWAEMASHRRTELLIERIECAMLFIKSLLVLGGIGQSPDPIEVHAIRGGRVIEGHGIDVGRVGPNGGPIAPGHAAFHCVTQADIGRVRKYELRVAARAAPSPRIPNSRSDEGSGTGVERR